MAVHDTKRHCYGCSFSLGPKVQELHGLQITMPCERLRFIYLALVSCPKLFSINTFILSAYNFLLLSWMGKLKSSFSLSESFPTCFLQAGIVSAMT